MKKKIIIGVILMFWLFVNLPAYADIIGTARLSLIKGDVVVLTGDTGGDWVAASINMPLMPGDRLWVPEGGRAEIQFISGTYLRADSNTEVDITSLGKDNQESIIQVAVPQGRTYIKYRGSSLRDSVFQVDTPLVSVMSYGSSKFAVDVYENGYTEVSALDGSVYVEDRHGNTKISEGNMLSVGEDNYAELSSLRPKDDWIRWNSSMDSRLARAGSSRYLPPELGVYGIDFDDYGRWNYVSNYGYVWTPTVIVTNWAPYRSGRWVWLNGDYVWISYEPWGWAPYHYGRWAFRVGIGWFWVPPAVNAVVWAPGLVAWIYTPTYISWVPLAPGEIYYGHGYYGSHSVNLTKVNIKTINITNIYVNSRVQNAVTVVNRETFITGKHVKVVNAPNNPFLSGIKVSPGRPDIRPVKATAMPLPNKIVPRKALPTHTLTEKIWNTGLKKRPVAKKENVSVFKAGGPAAPMQVTKVKRLRPITAVPKSGTGVSQEQRNIPEKPKVIPREGTYKPPVQQWETKGPHVQKAIPEKPKAMPKEGIGKPSVQQRAIPNAQVQKKLPEKLKGVPGAGVAKSPMQQQRESTKPQQQKKTVEKPSGASREGKDSQSPESNGQDLQGETPQRYHGMPGGGLNNPNMKGQGQK